MEEMEINEKERASDAMMRRMPAYYRRLLELEGLGFTVISSKELARRMGLTDSQIRHDFNAFGGFGRRGRGTRWSCCANPLATYWISTASTK